MHCQWLDSNQGPLVSEPIVSLRQTHLLISVIWKNTQIYAIFLKLIFSPTRVRIVKRTAGMNGVGYTRNAQLNLHKFVPFMQQIDIYGLVAKN